MDSKEEMGEKWIVKWEMGDKWIIKGKWKINGQ